MYVYIEREGEKKKDMYVKTLKVMLDWNLEEGGKIAIVMMVLVLTIALILAVATNASILILHNTIISKL